MDTRIRKYFLAFFAIFLVQTADAAVTLRIQKEKVRFKTSKADGTISTTRHGRPVTIGAITGYRFRVIATDLATNRQMPIDCEIAVSTRTTIPSAGQINGAIQSYVATNNLRGMAEDYFASIYGPPPENKIGDEEIDGIVDIGSPDINP